MLLGHAGNLVLFEVVPGGHVSDAFFCDFVQKPSFEHTLGSAQRVITNFSL